MMKATEKNSDLLEDMPDPLDNPETVPIFGEDLTEGQIDIVHSILGREDKRIVISACTRYGKTTAVAIATLLYILDNPGASVLLIAPSQRQTKIIRRYIAKYISRDERLTRLIDAPSGSSADRLRKEASRERITFKGEREVLTLTAGGKLMGFGGDLVVIDQSEDIPDDTYRQRISRMLGDNDDAKLVEITNPWLRNHVWDHWTNDRYKSIKIDWRQAVKEGRHTQEWIAEQREDLTDFEFTVLYEAEFPEESEDSLFKFSQLEDAVKREFTLDEKDHIFGLDVAGSGKDYNVLTHTTREGTRIKVERQWRWSESDTMKTVGRVDNILEKLPCDQIRVDVIGIGKGVADRLAERGHPVVDINVGRKPTKEKDRFKNLKAQGYMRLRTLFDEGLISLPRKSKGLIGELAEIKKKFTSSGRLKIEDPNKSPDRADSLMMSCLRFQSIGDEQDVGLEFL